MPDFTGLLRRLSGAGVDYVLVGGLAAAAHGSSLLTQDIDVCIRLGAENLRRLQRALHGLEPVHRMAQPRRPFDEGVASLDSFKNLYLSTKLGQLDCLGEVLGVGDYAAVQKQSIEIDLNGAACQVISLDALITAKSAMSRDRDRMAVEQLRAIKSLRERQRDR